MPLDFVLSYPAASPHVCRIYRPKSLRGLYGRLFRFHQDFPETRGADITGAMREGYPEVPRNELLALHLKEHRETGLHRQRAAGLPFLIQHFACGALEDIEQIRVRVCMQPTVFARLQNHLPHCNLFVLEKLRRCYFGHNRLLRDRNEAAILPQFSTGCERFMPGRKPRLGKLCSVPHVKAGDINVYYEIHGSGDQTLTLNRGLGADLLSWFPQVPEFSRHFQTLVFDNRGAGRSDKPDSPYSIQQMASDVNNLLLALQIERTALLGISMGGMIAQEFAIHYPEKLTCLILGCTSFGGPQSVPLPQQMLDAILAGPVADEEVKRLQEQALYSDDTILGNRSVISANVEARGRFPIPRFALARQATALLNHDAANRVEQIRVPTLVVTGMEDRLIPPANSRLLTERIPGATLLELPGGHLFTSEHPDAFNRGVIEFVKENSLVMS